MAFKQTEMKNSGLCDDWKHYCTDIVQEYLCAEISCYDMTLSISFLFIYLFFFILLAAL